MTTPLTLATRRSVLTGYPMLPVHAYQLNFMHSPVGECLLSPELVILDVNEVFLRSSGGRPREALVGHPLFDAFPEEPSSASGAEPASSGVAVLRRSLARVLETGRADPLALHRYPIEVTTAEGGTRFEERYWSATNTPIFDSAGTLLCIAHSTIDVTDKVGDDAQLRANTDRRAFQLELDACTRDVETTEQVCAVVCQLLGRNLGAARVLLADIDEAGDALCAPCDWVDPARGLNSLAGQQVGLAGFGPVVLRELQAGGVLRVEDVRTHPLTASRAAAYERAGVRSCLTVPLFKGGALRAVLSVHEDRPRVWTAGEMYRCRTAAERAWTAIERARAQTGLREANRRKDEFLAMLAHELRNPLAPISAAAQLLERGTLKPEQLRRTSEVIGRQVRHMTGLVDDLLDVSRVTRGLIKLEREPQDMQAVAAAAVEQVRPLIEAQRHRIDVSLPAQPVLVLGDSKRLVQVLANLLNNAAKYTPSGGHLWLDVQADEGEVRVGVQDDGIGMSAELQPRVFELFAQAERHSDRSQGGLGLGLALVKSLVELHGGTVRCASEGPGQGSRFELSLPRLRSEPAPLNGVDKDAPAGTLAPAHRDGLRVLVVDDNQDAAEMLAELLRSEGHQVAVEHRGQAGLARARREPPEVGLLDIGLPDMDGTELARRLRADPASAGATLIAITGYGQEQDRRAALAAGFDEHMVKPVDPQALTRRLAEIMQARPQP